MADKNHRQKSQTVFFSRTTNEMYTRTFVHMNFMNIIKLINRRYEFFERLLARISNDCTENFIKKFIKYINNNGR
jgi:hypothetical protein